MAEHEFNIHTHTHTVSTGTILFSSSWFIQLKISKHKTYCKLPTIKKVSFSHLKSAFTVTFLPSKSSLMLNFKPVFSFSSELLYNPAHFLSVWEWLQEMQVKSFSVRGQNETHRHAPLHFNGGSAKRLNCNGSGESRCVEGHCSISFVIVLCNTSHFVFNTVKSL